jgi:crotonobetainyl-CoA:carnitine CoA-transferase CaiB-like acyl-CoA transferase
VLDLSDERGLLCGKMLADLGADVVQIEPPAGNRARRIGPFHHDDPHPEQSLFWWSYAANKRSITLDIQLLDGRGIFERLVRTAHFLVESGTPGELAALGLGYERLAELNPALIVISITAFGQTGPYAAYHASDLVGMALAGFMYVTGDPDRAPIRVGFPHFYLHGSAAGAAGAMIAHMQRVTSGLGQHVDVSCQEAVSRALANALPAFATEGAVIVRQGAYRQTGNNSFMRITWPCKDGFVNFQFAGGASSGASVNNFIRWMADQGAGDEYLLSLDFRTLGYGAIPKESMDKIVPPVANFLLRYTKQELFEAAIERRILLFPVSTMADILESSQLQARRFFDQVRILQPAGTLDAHGSSHALTALGPFVRASATPLTMRRRAPRIGEHNQAIYQGELALERADLIRLRSAGVI